MNQSFVDRLYISPIAENTDIFIIYSSLNCGTAGCVGKIYSKDGGKLEYVAKAKDMYDCQNIDGLEDVYVCSLLR